MKKYLITLVVIAVLALTGGVIYFSIPKDDARVDLEVYAEDFSVVVDAKKQVKYSLSVNPSLVYVRMIVDDEMVAEVERDDDGIFFARGVSVGATSLTIIAKYGTTEAMKIIRINVVKYEPGQTDQPVEIEEYFEDIVKNVTDCEITKNEVCLNVGTEGMFTVYTSNYNMEDLFIENTNSKLHIESDDTIRFSTFKIWADEAGTFAFRCIINNAVAYKVTVVASA